GLGGGGAGDGDRERHGGGEQLGLHRDGSPSWALRPWSPLDSSLSRLCMSSSTAWRSALDKVFEAEAGCDATEVAAVGAVVAGWVAEVVAPPPPRPHARLTRAIRTRATIMGPALRVRILMPRLSAPNPGDWMWKR